MLQANYAENQVVLEGVAAHLSKRQDGKIWYKNRAWIFY